MTEIERFTKDPRRAQLLRQEQLILEVSEQIARWLTRRGEKVTSSVALKRFKN